jgi:hypothetical protein
MTALNRVRVALTGFPGGPGVLTLACLDATTIRGPLHTYLAAIAEAMPSDVSMLIEAVGDAFESTTGEITGEWTDAALAAVVGTYSGSHVGPAGVLVKWRTDTFFSGRRLRGHTFFVPSAGSMFGTDGQMTDEWHTAWTTRSATFQAAAAANLCIWQRPRLAVPADGSRPAIEARGGGHAVVTSSSVSTKAAVLRSRRD